MHHDRSITENHNKLEIIEVYNSTKGDVYLIQSVLRIPARGEQGVASANFQCNIPN